MRLLRLLKAITENLTVFMLLSVIVSYIFTKIPKRVFYYNRWIFRERKWENSGEVYQHIFKVKTWKKLCPS